MADAGGAVIGALRVVLGLDTAAFSSGLKEVKTGVAGLDSTLAGAGKSISGLNKVLGLLSAGALIAFLKTSTKAAETIVNTSDRLGVSTEAFQKYSFAAEVAGVSQEAMTNALSKFQKGLGESSDDVTKTQQALGRLGLTLTQLKALKPEDQFSLVAERLSRIEDPAKRASIEVALFGKAGGELDPLMRLGAKGIKDFGDEAQSLGIILGKDVLANAAAADDEFDKIGKILKASGIQIASEFLPVIRELKNIMASPDFQQGVKTIASGFAEFIDILVRNKDTVIGIVGAFAGMRVGLMTIGGPLGAVAGGLLGFALANKAAQSAVDQATQDYEAAKTALADYEANAQAGTSALSVMTGALAEDSQALNANSLTHEQLKKKVADTAAALQAAQVAANKFNLELGKPPPGPPFGGFDAKKGDEIAKALEHTRFEAALLGGMFKAMPEGMAPALQKLDQLKVSSDGLSYSITLSKDKVNEFSAAFGELTLRKMDESMKTDWEKLTENIEKARVAAKAWDKDRELAAKVQTKLQQQVTDKTLDGISQSLGGFADLAAGFAKTNKTMGVAAKAFGIAEAVVNTARAVMKIWADPTVPTWLAPVMIAGAVATGAAQVMKISTQSFAAGGSFMVPGGLSATDNHMVPLNLASGEQVEVTSASEAAGRVNERTITVEGIKPKDYYRGDVLRDILRNITEAVNDGYKFRLT